MITGIDMLSAGVKTQREKMTLWQRDVTAAFYFFCNSECKGFAQVTKIFEKFLPTIQSKPSRSENN